jgi:hypothetical protein
MPGIPTKGLKMEIDIGLTRKGLTKLRDNLTAALERDEDRPNAVVEIELYHASGLIRINNDDMEREDVGDDEVYVDVNP